MEKRGIDLERQKDEECPFCQSRIKSKSEICPNCGGNIKNVYKTDRMCPNCQRETNKKECPSCGVRTEPKYPASSSPQQPAKIQSSFGVVPQTTTPSGNNRNLLVAGVVGLIIAFVILMVTIFKPHDEVGLVSANSWTCSVPLQENQYNFHSDWSLPQGADLIRSYEKFHHNEKVEIGYKKVCENKWEVVGSHQEPKTKEVCTPGAYVETIETCDEETNVCTDEDIYEPDSCEDVPDGTVEVDDYGWVEHCEDVMQYKDEPVNQTWYEYNIWEWVSINPLSSSGEDNVVTCPVVTETETIHQNGNASVACQTSFSVEEKTYSYSPDCQNQFPAFSLGSSWLVTISGHSITEVNYLP
jgi:rRNA maturation protein Nop10